MIVYTPETEYEKSMHNALNNALNEIAKSKAEIAQLRARVAKLTELCDKMGVKVEDDK